MNKSLPTLRAFTELSLAVFDYRNAIIHAKTSNKIIPMTSLCVCLCRRLFTGSELNDSVKAIVKPCCLVSLQ